VNRGQQLQPPHKGAFATDIQHKRYHKKVIDLEFDHRLEKGGVLGNWMAELYKQGLSTGDALFTIASEMVEEQAVTGLETLIGTDIFKKAKGKEIHQHVKRNGEIKYRMPFKE
jgi:hypothetical protein